MQLRTAPTGWRNSADCSQYPANMPHRELTTIQAVARNLKALMERHGMTQTTLAKKSGVSQRHISSILNGETECGTEKANKLARVFGLQGWQLQMPNIPDDLLDSDLILKVVKAMADATPEGRDLIAKNAEREAFFSKRQ